MYACVYSVRLRVGWVRAAGIEYQMKRRVSGSLTSRWSYPAPGIPVIHTRDVHPPHRVVCVFMRVCVCGRATCLIRYLHTDVHVTDTRSFTRCCTGGCPVRRGGSQLPTLLGATVVVAAALMVRPAAAPLAPWTPSLEQPLTALLLSLSLSLLLPPPVPPPPPLH